MKQFAIIQLGFGNVGKTLFHQIRKARVSLQKDYNCNLNYIGIFTSEESIVSQKGITENTIRALSKQTITPENVLQNTHMPIIVIDVTASTKTLQFLLHAIKKNAFVVLANKKPLSSSQKFFNQLQTAGKKKLYFEATVGAGLPLIRTIKTLQETGDEITEILGCFSGTLGFLCNELERGRSFSETLALAKKNGYTEPDPRDDLAGTDVARKTLILARLLGKKLELTDIPVEMLFPEKMRNLSIEQFMQTVKSENSYFNRMFKKALKKKNTIRYIARITKSQVSVGLEAIEKNSIFGSLDGPANCILIKTKKYHDSPLIIAGPGAGAEVTSGGIFGDILSIID